MCWPTIHSFIYLWAWTVPAVTKQSNPGVAVSVVSHENVDGAGSAADLLFFCGLWPLMLAMCCLPNAFLHCLAPGVVIIGNVFPLDHIDHSNKNVFFTNVSVVVIGRTCRPEIIFQMTAKEVFWDMSTLHPSDVIEPSETLLTISTSMILPGYAEDVPKAKLSFFSCQN